MPAARYARPRLITSDDKRYREFNRQFTILRQNQRAMRPPRQRDLFGGQAELALRDWLGAQIALSERRILEYEERRNRSAATKYRELDALALEDDRTAWAFEFKASRTAGSLRRAVGQLNETREVLRLLYPTVYTTVLLVDTGIPNAEEVAALMAAPDAPTRPPQTLAEVLATLPQVHEIAALSERSREEAGVDLVRFSVNDIIALVGAEHLSLDWAADDDEPDPDQATPLKQDPAYSTPDEEGTDDDNPLAAALRRAGIDS